ncbi:MAG: hypothetical protein M1834_008277 [Cirrosporium novae-zelandiae]|nr:MAG: hypothetical protein M1834_008277 [Cirrosporium novae-zelandiae]
MKETANAGIEKTTGTIIKKLADISITKILGIEMKEIAGIWIKRIASIGINDIVDEIKKIIGIETTEIADPELKETANTETKETTGTRVEETTGTRINRSSTRATRTEEGPHSSRNETPTAYKTARKDIHRLEEFIKEQEKVILCLTEDDQPIDPLDDYRSIPSQTVRTLLQEIQRHVEQWAGSFAKPQELLTINSDLLDCLDPVIKLPQPSPVERLRMLAQAIPSNPNALFLSALLLDDIYKKVISNPFWLVDNCKDNFFKNLPTDSPQMRPNPCHNLDSIYRLQLGHGTDRDAHLWRAKCIRVIDIAANRTFFNVWSCSSAEIKGVGFSHPALAPSFVKINSDNSDIDNSNALKKLHTIYMKAGLLSCSIWKNSQWYPHLQILEGLHQRKFMHNNDLMDAHPLHGLQLGTSPTIVTGANNTRLDGRPVIGVLCPGLMYRGSANNDVSPFSNGGIIKKAAVLLGSEDEPAQSTTNAKRRTLGV